MTGGRSWTVALQAVGFDRSCRSVPTVRHPSVVDRTPELSPVAANLAVDHITTPSVGWGGKDAPWSESERGPALFTPSAIWYRCRSGSENYSQWDHFKLHCSQLSDTSRVVLPTSHSLRLRDWPNSPCGPRLPRSRVTPLSTRLSEALAPHGPWTALCSLIRWRSLRSHRLRFAQSTAVLAGSCYVRRDATEWSVSDRRSGRPDPRAEPASSVESTKGGRWESNRLASDSHDSCPFHW